LPMYCNNLNFFQKRGSEDEKQLFVI